jgi:2-polyprenyl-3-methyl-5-hydroxy-6-metoxy-1,4-benzoquinol methylase
LHDRPDYFDHPYFALRRAARRSEHRRCEMVFARLARAIDVGALRGERLLDIGCDTGGFLVAARDRYGVVPVGIDVSRRAVEAARARGVDARQATIEQAPEDFRDFAAITAIDLIEHVADPAAFISEVRRRLRQGGAVYLETPNFRSAVYAAGRWLAAAGAPRGPLERLFPAEHVHYFTAAAMAAMAERAGLEVVEMATRPLAWGDIAASAAVRLAMAPLQALDGITGRGILICALLRRRAGS